MSIIEEKQTRERLLNNVKKECKQLMEVAVTRKYIHEDNSCITSLSATVELCLLHGLKRNGLFKSSTTLGLLQKISKSFEPAAVVLQMCEEYEKAYCSTWYKKPALKRDSSLGKNSSSQENSNGSFLNFKLFSNLQNNAQTPINNSQSNGQCFVPTFFKGSSCYKFLWIRMALLNKSLTKLIDYIVSNADKFYFPFALVADPVDGPIFSSLLVGPCALEFTRVKTYDYIWSDPNADELIQRHKMHSAGLLYSPNILNGSSVSSNSPNLNSSFKISPKPKLGLNGSVIAKRKASLNVLDDLSNLKDDELNQRDRNVSSKTHNRTNKVREQSSFALPSPCVNQNTFNFSSAKEYVESLHQNSRSQLIYGKNHVRVSQRETNYAGYLSLHANFYGLVLKWTPNQIMTASPVSIDDSTQNPLKTKNELWNYAIQIDMNSIVYLHCHQQGNASAKLVLVAQDGVQYPPIIFPKGGHLLQFLSCLENGLSPKGKLDPPLWDENGKGKIFPKLNKKSIKQKLINEENSQEQRVDLNEQDEDENFVFRIINTNSNTSVKPIFEAFKANNKSLEFSINPNEPKVEANQYSFFKALLPESLTYNKNKIGSLLTTTETLTMSKGLDKNKMNLTISSVKDETSPSYMTTSVSPMMNLSNDFEKANRTVSVRSSLKNLCDNIKNQILSRAFYGWLAYHRNLKTVRIHLIRLINFERKDEECNEETGSDDETKNSKEKSCLYLKTNKKIDENLWSEWENNPQEFTKNTLNFYRIVYFNGIESDLRKKIWPFLLDHYKIDMTFEEKKKKDEQTADNYNKLIQEWKPFEELNHSREQKKFVRIVENKSIEEKELDSFRLQIEKRSIENKGSNDKNKIKTSKEFLRNDSSFSNDVFMEDSSNVTNKNTSTSPFSMLNRFSTKLLFSRLMQRKKDNKDLNDNKINSTIDETLDYEEDEEKDYKEVAKKIVDEVIKKSQSLCKEEQERPREVFKFDEIATKMPNLKSRESSLSEYTDTKNALTNTTASSIDDIYHDVGSEIEHQNKENAEDSITIKGSNSDINQIKPDNDQSSKIKAQNENSIENNELIEAFSLNMNRIDKDVSRCDRNYWYFMSNENLQKLKNIMYTYVWENLSVGYIQGMCDLVAPLLVIFDNEPMAYSCFKQLMKRMSSNFPHGNAMDQHFTNMKTLIQILDSDLFEHMHKRGDYTHFYFSYRWFLLDFKRELVYDDVFSVWETIWAAKFLISAHFHLFIGLALVETYRDIIIDNNMDFTDIIKFFNEMAEKHNTKELLNLARSLLDELKQIIDNKDEKSIIKSL